MAGGKQILSLATGCFPNRPATTIHEFFHALGFYHEQSRTDRDDYVTIIEENIIEGKTEYSFGYTECSTVYYNNIDRYVYGL